MRRFHYAELLFSMSSIPFMWIVFSGVFRGKAFLQYQYWMNLISFLAPMIYSYRGYPNLLPRLLSFILLVYAPLMCLLKGTSAIMIIIADLTFFLTFCVCSLHLSFLLWFLTKSTSFSFGLLLPYVENLHLHNKVSAIVTYCFKSMACELDESVSPTGFHGESVSLMEGGETLQSTSNLF